MSAARRPLALLGAALLLLACATLALSLRGALAAGPTCNGKEPTIVSDEARIVGGDGPDVILAGSGSSQIEGLGGNDTICAGAGEDVVFGGRGSDYLNGGAGRDRVAGESGNDEVDGGPGAEDTVDGGAGDDTVSGGLGGFDIVIGGAGRDRLDGGPGVHDIAAFREAGGPLQIDLGAGTVSGAESEPLSGIEDALGGAGDDTLVGSAGSANRLDGGPGDDRLTAVGPGDEAYGGPGEDRCAGGFAARLSCGRESGGGDRTAVDLYRGIGNASSLSITGSRRSNHVNVSWAGGSFVVHSRTPSVGVQLGDRHSRACRRRPGSDSIVCRGGATSIVAALGDGNDVLVVDDSVPDTVSAVIDGGGGSDRLSGGPGRDTIYGGDDRLPDRLEGGGGDDILYGVNIFHPRRGSGAAGMFGGPGNDLLIGGQPCDGDIFDGGPGDGDSASFARVRNSGTFVAATIGGAVHDPDLSPCRPGRIAHSVEEIEGSPGPDLLRGDAGPNDLLGRGGDDRLEGRGGRDRCTGGNGSDLASGCEIASSIP